MWALARSPDPDLALRALDRLAGANAREWTACEAALRGDVVLRGRLFALLGGSTALGDHLVSHPDRWRRLTAAAPDACTDVATRTASLLTAVGADPDGPPAGAQGAAAASLRDSEAVNALRTAYRDEMLALAAADLAAVSEPSLPILPLEDVAAQLADLATAALRAALAVALAETDGEPGRLAVIAMGKTGGAELNYVSDVDVVFVAEPADQGTTRLAARMMRIAGEACFPVDANLRPEGTAGRAGPHARRARGLLQAVGQDLGVPGAAQGAPGRGRPRPGQGLRRGRRADGVDGRGPARLRRGRAGHAPPRRGARAPGPRRPRAQARPRRAARRRVRRPAAPARARPRRSRAPLPDDARRARHPREPRVRRARRRGEPRRLLPLPAPAGAPAAAAAHAPHASAARRGRHGRAALARTGRQAAARRPARRRRGADRGVAAHARRVRRLHEKLFYRPLLDAVSRVSDAGLSAEAATVRLGALGWASPEGALHHIRRADRRGVAGGRDPEGRCCRCCSTSSPAPRTRTAGCWPTAACPRRSPAPPGTCACCGTRGWSPSG